MALVEVFTLPKPFYCGNVYEETKVNDNIYIFVKNYARNLCRFFGYEYLDCDGECMIRKISDDFDENLYY